MWIEWNDPSISEETQLLLIEHDGELAKSEIDKYEFFLVKSVDDLDRIETEFDDEFLRLGDKTLYPWRRSCIEPIPIFGQPLAQVEKISAKDIKDMELKESYPFIVARMKKTQL